MLRVLLLVSVWIALLFSFSSSVSAAFSISTNTSDISDTGSVLIQVDLSVSGANGVDYYLRGAFAHIDAQSSYFGYTKDQNGSWYNGSSSQYTNYYKITTNSEGSWSGLIEVKPDVENSYYKGTGTYNFRMGRYTQAGSGPTWAGNTLQIALTSTATPTPSPSLTPSPSPTIVPSPTPAPTSTVTSTPTLKPKASFTPKPKLSPSPSPEVLAQDSTETTVLGIQEEQTPTPSPEARASLLFSSFSPVAIGLIVVGASLLGFSVFSLVKSTKSGKITKD